MKLSAPSYGEDKDRGKTGYDLTEKFFDMIQQGFPDVEIRGPKRAGSDIQTVSLWEDYPQPKSPS